MWMSVVSSRKASVRVPTICAKTRTLVRRSRSPMEKWWLAVCDCYQRHLTSWNISGLLWQLQGKVQQGCLQVLSSQFNYSRTVALKRSQPSVSQRSNNPKDSPTGLCAITKRAVDFFPNVRAAKLQSWSWRQAISRCVVRQSLPDNVPKTPCNGSSFPILAI